MQTARDLLTPDALSMLQTIEATGSFAEVHLVSHQVREDAPGRPIQFSVQASFKGKP